MLGSRFLTIPNPFALKRPPVQVDYRAADLGSVVEGAMVRRTIALVNQSNRPLVIERVQTSCGCTTLDAPQSIAAHHSANVGVQFNSAGKRGGIHESATITVVGYPQTPVYIPLSGSVTRHFTFSESSLDLTVRTTHTITIKRIDGQPLRAAVLNTAPLLRASLIPINTESANLIITLAQPGNAGSHQDKVTVVLNDPGLPRVEIPIYWNVPSSFAVAPATINFGFLEPGATGKQLVRITGQDASPLRLGAIPKGITAHLQRTGAREMTLATTWTAKGGTNPLLHSRITLLTRSKREPVLEIPVYAAVDNSNSSAEACTSQP